VVSHGGKARVGTRKPNFNMKIWMRWGDALDACL
jgi:hypothetical protein